MFPYKGFFERHYNIGYGLLILSIFGILFIPWFNRWLKSKEEIYNHNLKLNYKVLILDKLFFYTKGRNISWEFKHLENSEDQLIIAFNRITYRNISEENCRYSDDSLREWVLSRNELNELLARQFGMTETQAAIVWNGLYNKHEDFMGCNKMGILKQLIHRGICISRGRDPLELWFTFKSKTNPKYRIKIIKYPHPYRNVLVLKCSFAEWHTAYDFEFGFARFATYESDDENWRTKCYEDDGLSGCDSDRNDENSVLISKLGLKRLLKIFFGLIEDEARLIVEEVFTIKIAPEVRRTAYLLDQARRTNENFRKLPNDLCIKIAALTASDGTDLRTAEQVAATCLCKPKPCF